MPELRMNLPQVPDTPWQDAQFTFDGQWMPDLDAALIGPENFATLKNLRYKDKGIEGVSGYTKVNSTTALETYPYIRNGFQLRTPFTTTSYNLVHTVDDSDQGVVYQNQTAIGSAGDFEATALHTDTTTGLTGRFSLAPQGNVVYCNGKETRIWAGNESSIAAIFTGTDDVGSNIVDVTDILNSSLTSDTITFSENLVPNGTMEADSDWAAVGTPTTNERSSEQAHSGTYSRKFVWDAADEGVASTAFSMDGSSEYTVSAWVYSATDTALDMIVLDGDGSELDNTEYTITSSIWNKITVAVTSAASGSSAQVKITGTDAAGTAYVDDVTCTETSNNNRLFLLTTRPAQGFKFYISSANATASTLSCKYWNGSAWTAVSSPSDGTKPATIALAQTGTFSFTSTDGSAEPKHFQELFLYAYMFELSAGDATIYQVTVDKPWQTIKDVWDGVYRQPIQFQMFDVDHYEDYTLHVNQSSDVNTPVGGQLDGLVAATDHVIVMFEDQVTAMRFTMLGDLVNTNASVMTVSYWDGYDWQDTSNTDGTDVQGDTLAQTGLTSWETPTDEQKQTLFGSLGYAYQITFSNTLSGAKDTDAEVLVDLCYGIPSQLTVDPFDFSVLYKSRLMLGGFSAGNQGNRMDFSASNAPDVWNGSDSSNDGSQSLFFGGEEKITCATQLYNRFGSNIFSMLLVLKAGETYILTGDTPRDFQIFPVSHNTGCPAPLTLATAEVGFEAGTGVQRQVAIWCSHAGPMMFDGAVLQPIRGIDLYFDPSEDEFVDWDNMNNARGWVDHVFKEYNLLLPSGSSQTTNNVWLVYDLIRKKWFQKDTGTEEYPQAAWSVMASDGEKGVYGGTDDGYMVEIEEGQSWNCTYASPTGGSPIEQRVRSGDFFPSNNIWDEVLIRKFKLICEKISSDVTVNLSTNYYQNAANDASNVVFQDSGGGTGSNVDFTDMDVDSDGTAEVIWASAAEAVLSLNADVGTDRLVRLIQDLNQRGWAHSFEFVVSTSDVKKGWKPIAWGIRYRVDRKDDTAT